MNLSNYKNMLDRIVCIPPSGDVPLDVWDTWTGLLSPKGVKSVNPINIILIYSEGGILNSLYRAGRIILLNDDPDSQTYGEYETITLGEIADAILARAYETIELGLIRDFRNLISITD
jgi:hypothetical protein